MPAAMRGCTVRIAAQRDEWRERCELSDRARAAYDSAMAASVAQHDFALSSEQTARALLDLLNVFLSETHGAASPAVKATLDSSLERDLGIDSLGRFELWLRVEHRFGVGLPEGTLGEVETPRDMLRALLASSRRGREAHAVDFVRLADDRENATPEAATTLLEILDWHVRKHPNRMHITVLEDEAATATLTYAELAEDVATVAGGLQAEGVELGQTVAIMLPTGRDFFAAYYGVLAAGGIPVPIYPPVRMARIAEHVHRQAGILRSALARLLITVREAKPIGVLLRGQVPSLARVATVDDLRAHTATPERVRVTADDVAFIQYTSGSTGNPKGVVLTHANLLASIRAMGRATGATSADVFVSWLPLYHDMGLIGAWLCPLYFALPLVVMSPLDFLSRPARWLWAIHRYRGTISAAPNFAYELCATRLQDEELAGLDLTSWRWAFNGAEAVSADTMEKFAARFARYGFDPQSAAPVYGLAECTLDLAFPTRRRGLLIDRIDRHRIAADNIAHPAAAGDKHPLRVVACGQPLPGHAIRIANDAGREVPERHIGRVQFQGPSATSGYYRNPEATAALFDGPWLDTGDLGYVAEGELYLSGRAKDTIIRAGHNLYPHELEEAIGNVSGIRKGCVAVFGAPDRASGTERLIVLAETRETDAAKRADLAARVNALTAELIGGAADDVVLGPPHTVLKTSSGKIRRSATRAVYERGLVGVPSPAAWRQIVALSFGAACGRLAQWYRHALPVSYACYVWCELAILGTVACLASLVLPRALARRAMRAIARAGVRLSGLSIAIEGIERLPQQGAVVVVANHASYSDGLLFYAMLPERFTFAAKEGFARNPITRRFFAQAGAFFVDRFDRARGVEATRELTRIVAAGGALAVFPEGTFTRTPGVRPFRMGAFVIAASTGTPLVPIVFRGSRSVLRENDWLIRRGTIRVVIGEPLMAMGSDWHAAARLRDAARAKILRHCGEPDLAAEAQA
jgi:1-acyl-sn-glycerol-3-phosphate acyltransferase